MLKERVSSISDRCANKIHFQSVLLAYEASRRTLSGWTRTPTRKKDMYANIQHQLNSKKKCHVCRSVANVPKRGRERGNAGRMACSPTLTIPKPFLAPPTCLCTVVTDGSLNELPLERWWGRRRG